jgi:hypothetical protein
MQIRVKASDGERLALTPRRHSTPMSAVAERVGSPLVRTVLSVAYPEQLKAKRIEGSLSIRYWVNPSGCAEPESFYVMEANDSLMRGCCGWDPAAHHPQKRSSRRMTNQRRSFGGLLTSTDSFALPYPYSVAHFTEERSPRRRAPLDARWDPAAGHLS